MKEFIEKLIGRLEEVRHDNPMITRNYILRKDAIEIVNQLAEEYNNSNDSMEIQIAKNYAKWITKCGVNVTEKWETATQQASALNEAYMRGRQDERDRFAEWQEEHNNGWIPCSAKLPKDGHTFKVWLSFTTPFTSFSKAAWWVESHFEWDNGKAVKEKPIAWMQYNVPAPYIPKQEEQKGIKK